MEVLSPRPSSPEFFFNTDAAATPYATAPSSPRFSGDPFDRHFHYPSAPTSPSRAAAIYSSWAAADEDDILDFAFDSGRRSEISTADELFEKGRIRPTHPPPPAAARGRERRSPVSASRSRARETRSLSPLRDDSSAAPAENVSKSVGGIRKWRLRDFLLFRSASEGSATDRVNRDPLFLSSSGNKKKGGDFDSKGGSFRSTESGGGSVRRGRKAAAAAEMHYTAMRAAAEEQRKKTPLAYQRPGLFSCIQFNPAIRSITKGFSGGGR